VRALKFQYVLSYAVIGALMPYLSVFFKARGLDEVHIGYVMAAASVAMMLSPALVALLADTRVDARVLIVALFVLTAATAVATAWAGGFVAILLLWVLHSAAFWPINPLQDALFFADVRRRAAEGGGTPSFESVRVWGSIGFMVPSGGLFWLLRQGFDVRITLWVAAAFAVLGALNAARLPRPGGKVARATPSAPPPVAPTWAAASVLARRPLRVFCVAIFLLYLGTSAHMAYFPLLLTQRFGVRDQWLGLINNVGVVVEVVFILGYARVVRTAKPNGVLKKLMLVGVGCTALRMALLAIAPNAAVAAATQVFHGVLVLAMLVAPPQFLDRHAHDWYRNSIQGVFAMLVPGVGRIVGNLAAGAVAQWSLRGVFAYSAILCVGATVLVAVAFREEAEAAREVEPLPPAPAEPRPAA
jgi:PPP family 3-phenylpropionic acid transporter